MRRKLIKSFIEIYMTHQKKIDFYTVLGSDRKSHFVLKLYNLIWLILSAGNISLLMGFYSNINLWNSWYIFKFWWLEPILVKWDIFCYHFGVDLWSGLGTCGGTVHHFCHSAAASHVAMQTPRGPLTRLINYTGQPTERRSQHGANRHC